MTSVKEFRIAEPATPESLGRGSFVFTDDYSIFDWGKMPDQIPQKGASLCTMGAFNFELLESTGVPTHYRGVRSNDTLSPLDDVSSPPREMAIDLTQVPELPHEGRDYDYESFHAAAGENYLVPLEIVFRNSVPVGSSLRRRSDPEDHGLEYANWPADAIELDDPIIEFSTKFEEGDRYLDRNEARDIAGKASLDELERTAQEVNQIITDRAEAVGLTHEDGKIECLYYDGEIRVADVVGTFDENRFDYEGTQLSKEVLRQYHKRTQPEWVDAVADAKSRAKEKNVADWKSLCSLTPEPLDDAVVQTVRNMYCAGTNAYTDRSFFDVPSLSGAVGAIQRL